MERCKNYVCGKGLSCADVQAQGKCGTFSNCRLCPVMSSDPVSWLLHDPEHFQCRFCKNRSPYFLVTFNSNGQEGVICDNYVPVKKKVKRVKKNVL